MIGVFRIFGRARELQRLDESLRDKGLHPRLLPDAVKLTVVRLLRNESGKDSPPFALYNQAAELLVYCRLGVQGYAEENGLPALDAVEGRLEAAFEAGDSLDARLVLLMLHSNLVQPSVIERYDLRVEAEAPASDLS